MKKQNYLLYSLLLFAAAFGAYWPVLQADFIIFDDKIYVLENPMVARGFNFETILQAFGEYYEANYIPITWLSHVLDAEIYELNAAGHHFTNLLFHAVNSVLVFVLFAKLLKKESISFWMALVFAVHPFHVESVAWVAERKDMLHAFFGLLCAIFYVRAVKQDGELHKPFYLASLFVFLCGLLSKPMLVTWPFVLLLLDFWPLRRMKSMREAVKRTIEKIPFFVLVAGVCVITFIVQSKAEAVLSTDELSWVIKIKTVLFAYAVYFLKTLFPFGFHMMHLPLTGDEPNFIFVGAFVLLATVSVYALIQIKKRPHLLIGWLIFLGMLVPVIGFVKVGMHSMADRYMYLPILGLILALGYELFLQYEKGSARFKKILEILASGFAVFCFFMTMWVSLSWQNSYTLLNRTLQLHSEHYLAHKSLADYFYYSKNIEQARVHLKSAAEKAPRVFPSLVSEYYYNLGVLDLERKNPKSALGAFSEALRHQPDKKNVYTGMAYAYEQLGYMKEAQEHLEKAQEFLTPERG